MTFRTMARAGIAVLFLLVAAFQVRASLETIHLGKHLDYWLPFWVEPFSNRIDGGLSQMYSGDPLAAQIPDRSYGQMQLLAVNHLPFNGMAMYLTRLRNRHATIGTDGTLVVLVSYEGLKPIEAQFVIPHCTCGTTPTVILAELYLVAPMLCCLAGFALIAKRPDTLDAWAMCALLLACSQLRLVPDGAGFQITVNTMSWPDWLRIPGTAYQVFARNVWPPALVLVSANMFGTSHQFRKAARLFALPLFLACMVQVALAVAWSEDYLPFVSTYQWMESHRTPMIAAAFLATGFASFLHSQFAGLLVMLLALVGISALYWPAQNVLHGSAQSFSEMGAIQRDYAVMPLTIPRLLTIRYPSRVNAVVTIRCSTNEFSRFRASSICPKVYLEIASAQFSLLPARLRIRSLGTLNQYEHRSYTHSGHSGRSKSAHACDAD